jgi:hypothetical protein
VCALLADVMIEQRRAGAAAVEKHAPGVFASGVNNSAF